MADMNTKYSTLEENIWKDRKHHCWFPLSFTKYEVKDGRIYINTGFLSSREDECLLYRVMDISLTRTLLQKLFGTGTIEMNTKDSTTPIIRLVNIKHPVEVKRMLSRWIEEDREKKRVTGRDMYGASSNPDYDQDLDAQIDDMPSDDDFRHN